MQSGPVWRGGGHGEAELLASAHRRTVEVAGDLHGTSISFPAISCGIYGYPPELAAPQAIAAVGAALAARLEVESVRFVFLDEGLRRTFADAAEALAAPAS